MKMQERPRFQLGFYRDMGDEDTGETGGTQTPLQLAPLNLKPSPGPKTTAAGSPGTTYAQKMAHFAVKGAMNTFSPLAGRASFGGIGGLGDILVTAPGIGVDQSTGLQVAVDPSANVGDTVSSGTSIAQSLTPDSAPVTATSPSGNSDLTNAALKGLIAVGSGAAVAGVQIGSQAAYRAAFGVAPPQPAARPIIPAVTSGLSGLLIPALLVGAVFMFAEEKGASSAAPKTNPRRKRKNTRRRKKNAKRKGKRK